MLKAKHVYIYSLFIQVQIMHQIIYHVSSKQDTMLLSIIDCNIMETFKSYDMFHVAKGSNVGISTFFYI